MLFYGHLRQGFTGSDVGMIAEGVLENLRLFVILLSVLLEALILPHLFVKRPHAGIQPLGRDPYNRPNVAAD